MKKLLAILLATTMTLGLFTVTAQAADPTIEVTSVTAEAGDTVTVDISIKNNPGIATTTITPTYDTTNLTLVADDCVAGKGLTLAVGKNLVITSSNGKNITDDQVFATLTFKVADKAPAAKYDISFKVNRCRNQVPQNVTLTPNPVVSTITVEADEPKPEIKEASVVVEDNLTLKIGVDVPETIELPKVRFTVDEFTSTVTGTEEGEYTYFSFKGITATNMADNIGIEVLDDDGNVAAEKDYSIRTYCNDVYNNAKNPPSTSLKTLLANMLNYGAESQKYVGHNTSNLANNLTWISDNEEAYDLPTSDYKVNQSYVSSDCRIKSGYLNLNGDVRMRFSVLTTDPTKTVLDLTLGGITKSYDVSKCEKDGSGAYIVMADGLCATQYGSVYTATLKYNGSTVHSIDYSVNSYIASKQSSTVSNLANLVKSINNYGKAALEYVQECSIRIRAN